jgi:hypothetical protein
MSNRHFNFDRVFHEASLWARRVSAWLVAEMLQPFWRHRHRNQLLVLLATLFAVILLSHSSAPPASMPVLGDAHDHAHHDHGGVVVDHTTLMTIATGNVAVAAESSSSSALFEPVAVEPSSESSEEEQLAFMPLSSESSSPESHVSPSASPLPSSSSSSSSLSDDLDADAVIDTDPFKIKYSIPKQMPPVQYWQKFDVSWKFVHRTQSMAFLDEYLSELERETADMIRDFDNAIEQKKIEIQWQLDHQDDDAPAAPVPRDDPLRVRDCVRQIVPLLGREKPMRADALVYAGPSDRYDGAWLDKSWILASTGERVAGGAQSATRCLGERWIMFLGDANAHGMFAAAIERLSALPDWRKEETGDGYSDRDALFINRLFEKDGADGKVEHRMMYLSFRRVESFADTEKLERVLRHPTEVLSIDELGRWQYDRPAHVRGLKKSIFVNHTLPDVTVVSLGSGMLPSSPPASRSASDAWLTNTMVTVRKALDRLRAVLEPETFRAKSAGRRVVYRLVSKHSADDADNYSILRLNRAIGDVVRRESKGRADVLDPWRFFPTYINRNISMSLDQLHLEESIDDLKQDDGVTDSQQLQRLLVDVVLDQLCDNLAKDRAEEARLLFAQQQQQKQQ